MSPSTYIPSPNIKSCWLGRLFAIKFTIALMFCDLIDDILAKGDKHSYLMCFVKLMNINGTTLADEKHELVVYKVLPTNL
jgi:hypothetical protein